MTNSNPTVLQPKDFEVNQSWFAFRANQLPVLVEGKKMDIFVLQDAASLYILGTTFSKHGATAPDDAALSSLLRKAWSVKQEWPTEFVVPGKLPRTSSLQRAAKELGIPVRAIPEAQMSFHIKDVQLAMEEFLSRDASGA